MMIFARQLRPEDGLTTVLRLCKEYFAEYEGHHKEFFDTDDLCDADISGRFLESLDSDNSATIIALVDDAIVGYASVVIRDQRRFYKIKKVGAISALIVAKNHWRQEIGTLLLAEAKAYFHGKGIKSYKFYTAVANQGATRFFEKIGTTALDTSFIGET